MLLLVHDIDAVVAWYAALLVVPSQHGNPRSAFVRMPRGVFVDSRSADARGPRRHARTSARIDCGERR